MNEQGIEAYPLQWPAGWKRTRNPRNGAFHVAFAKSRDLLLKEVRLLSGRDPIISSNIPLRRDGLPYANTSQPEDTGVAVYFKYKDKNMCFASDSYRKVEDNMRALALTIGAIRGMERWGASDMMERAFTGFLQLASPMAFDWRDVLGINTDADWSDTEAAYKAARSAAHPDKGGSPEAFNRVEEAFKAAKQYYGMDA